MNRATPTTDRRPTDGSSAASRLSKTNRQGHSHPNNATESDIAPSDLPDGTGHRAVSYDAGVSLRDECVMVETDTGHCVPVSRLEPEHMPDGDRLGRPMYRVVDEWRNWMRSYESAHIEFESPSGETVRTRLENSYQQQYDRRYYARLKDLERGVKRRYGDDMTTVMLTETTSNINANGHPRAPGDTMRETADGWDTARKQVHQLLDEYDWEYARIWEPHKSGYGHLHIGLFIDDPGDEIEASDFEATMASYVEATTGAATDAHTNQPCDGHDDGDHWGDAVASCDECDTPVSLTYGVDTLAGYLSEYMGIYGEAALERPMNEQMFLATTWATNTRRLDFSNGAQAIIAESQFVRETGLRPEDRGESGGDGESDTEATDGDVSESWDVDSICHVSDRRPSYADPTVGGVGLTVIDGRPGVDPPPCRE